MHNMPGIPVGALRDPAGPDDGGGRPLHHHDRRQGRPCGAPARMRRLRSSWRATSITALQTVVSRNVDPLEFGRRLGLLGQGRRHLQRHPADRDAARHRADADERGARPLRDAHPRRRRQRLRRLRRHGEDRVQPRLPGHRERPGEDRVHGRSREAGLGRRGRRHRRPAAHGRGGFLLHARDSAPAPTSSSATATRPASTTRPTISTTRRRPTACRSGRRSSRRECLHGSATCSPPPCGEELEVGV